jgi:hypothetical protein
MTLEETKVRLRKSLILGLGLCAALPAWGAADPFSEHEVILCAVASASECDPEGGCRPSTPDAINFARFATVDMKNRVIKSVWPSDLHHETLVEQLVETEAAIVLQGMDDEVAWSMTVEKPSGRFSAAASGVGVVFVLDGTCMPELPK